MRSYGSNEEDRSDCQHGETDWCFHAGDSRDLVLKSLDAWH
jgi:hypothetical protein